MWVCLATFVVVAALGGRYGFHRDELYFVQAGRHPALAYADQPAVVPLLAAAWYDLVGGRLWAFRLVPAAAGAVVVALAARTSRELGGDRADTAWTAVVVATATTLLVTAHLFGTSVFDIALTSLTVLLLVRAVRTGGARSWLLTGVAAAGALSVKTLPGTVLACCAVALLLVGPRTPFRSPWAWSAGVLALLGLAPTLLWQRANGWPQADLAASIAAGGSGTSVERALLVPMLPTLTGLTSVVLVVGAVALWRRRPTRWLAVATLLLVVVLVVTGGKPYYLFGLVPVLVAAGVPVLRGWAAGSRARGGLLVGGVVVNGAVSVVLALPVLPAALAPVAVVYDHGEQVGWAELVSTVEEAAVGADLVLAQNYGQAGALDRARSLGSTLPPVASGHNAYWWWGPPAGEPSVVVAVGWRDPGPLDGWFTSCEQVSTVTNDAGVDNDEAGTPVRLCTGPRQPWAGLWPAVQRLG